MYNIMRQTTLLLTQMHHSEAHSASYQDIASKWKWGLFVMRLDGEMP